MKRIASSLLVLALSGVTFAPVAKAEVKLNSFDVATLAYQGRLSVNGVPSYASLEASISSGTITAEDVVEAAIASGYLTESTRQDNEFITAVERQLQNLVTND